MKDFLEELEIGEGKVKLSKEEIKSILAKHGEYIKIETDKVDNKYKDQLEDNKTAIEDLKIQIEKAPKPEEMESLKSIIADYEKKESDRTAQEKAKAEDDILTNNINDAIGETKFVNDYTKNAVISEIKNALQDKANAGKSAKDLFNEIIKDRTDVISSPNQMKDMEGMGDMEGMESSKNSEIKLNPIFKNYN